MKITTQNKYCRPSYEWTSYVQILETMDKYVGSKMEISEISCPDCGLVKWLLRGGHTHTGCVDHHVGVIVCMYMCSSYNTDSLFW
jgi:hypothetical protein